MTKAEKRAFHAKLEEWRDEYRLLCAQDIIASGDRFKVERQLITQLQDVVRTSDGYRRFITRSA